tara:strand:- start:219 stop:695 length:477 start_codon:yes stop_codon:yes gene_type:complete
MEGKSQKNDSHTTTIEILVDGKKEFIVFEDICDDRGVSSGQFYLSLPTGMGGKWTEKYGGIWVATLKLYVFSTRKIVEIEKHLNLTSGASNIKNPENNYEIIFRGSIHIPDGKEGFKQMKKKLAEIGIKYSAQGKRFDARMEDMAKVRAIEEENKVAK